MAWADVANHAQAIAAPVPADGPDRADALDFADEPERPDATDIADLAVVVAVRDCADAPERRDATDIADLAVVAAVLDCVDVPDRADTTDLAAVADATDRAAATDATDATQTLGSSGCSGSNGSRGSRGDRGSGERCGPRGRSGAGGGRVEFGRRGLHDVLDASGIRGRHEVGPVRAACVLLACMSRPVIVTVLQCKGGVGKTTVATNLAACAHLAGLKTLLLDLEDPRHRGLSSMWFALRSAESPLRDLVTHLAPESWTPSHFTSVASGYDLVVCDAPASLARATKSAATVSDLAIVPMLVGPAEVFALDPVGELVDEVNRQRAKLGVRELPWACVLNRVEFGTKENQAMAEQLMTRVDLLSCVLGDRLAYRRAIAAGECAMTYKPRDAAAAQEAWLLFERVAERTVLGERKLVAPSMNEGKARRRKAA